MKPFEVNISDIVSEFLISSIAKLESYIEANEVLFDMSGIQSFFTNNIEFCDLKNALNGQGFSSTRNQTEYGDYQTNTRLAEQIVNKLLIKNINPDIILEPTFGEGNFILAAIKGFKNIKTIYGIEIYKPYVWQTKFNILDFFIQKPQKVKPTIVLSHGNIFDYDFNALVNKIKSQNLLILGNPPWVTNSKLGTMDSSNLPVKSNFKKLNGFDAITGKGNFDIAEYITLIIFDNFKHHACTLAFLVKKSVVKNIIHDQQIRQYPIGEFQAHSIDTKKEFNAAVESCLFYCTFGIAAGYECQEYDFYSDNKARNIFGWYNNKFVSILSGYVETENFDGICPFEWRQGIKHDCSTIMELEANGSDWINGNSENVCIENDIVYNLLKSSDLKDNIVTTSRKYTIVTQTKIGQDTSYIKNKYPKTFEYLNKNKGAFEKRKSSIYNGKPPFSIFGVGDYSFKKYKVAISGLYKESRFALVMPQGEKPIMLDDTCYFLGFDNLDFALYTYILLNHQKTQTFLKSITFLDAKRVFTKNNLMRLDLRKIALSISIDDINLELENLNSKIGRFIPNYSWLDYLCCVKSKALTRETPCKPTANQFAPQLSLLAYYFFYILSGL